MGTNEEADAAVRSTAKKAGVSIDAETEKDIQELVKPIVMSMGAAAVTAVATAVISKLVVTSLKEKDVSGDRELTPTEQKTAVSKSEAAASETEGKLSKDGVSGQDGSIKANETEAKASTGEATATEAGAQALRTKAGASDIETKALKIT